jgi:cytochrome c551/c552
MKSATEFSRQRKLINVVNERSAALRGRAKDVLVCICLTAALISCSSPRSSQSPRTLTEFDTSGKSPREIAEFVFQRYSCNGCHTLGEGGKLGFTERGKEVGKNFEGCISLLTAMNVMVHVREENRTAEEKRKAAHFQEFGCVACHQITPGKMGLTEVGSKLASLHMACTDAQRILSQR